MCEPGSTAVFITPDALITVRPDARWDDSPDLVRYGVGFLPYGLLDHLVDGH